MTMTKRDEGAVVTCLAVVITFFIVPFLVYLYIGFFSWMAHDPLNVIDWPKWGTGVTLQPINASDHD